MSDTRPKPIPFPLSDAMQAWVDYALRMESERNAGPAEAAAKLITTEALDAFELWWTEHCKPAWKNGRRGPAEYESARSAWIAARLSEPGGKG